MNKNSRDKETPIYKRLSDEQQKDLIRAGIKEFADKGFSGANLSHIAKSAGISVGVIYKYYEDKNALFLACVHYGMESLSRLLRDIISHEDNLELCVKTIINVLIQTSIDGNEINRMYHTISSMEASIFAKELAKEIESVTAEVYTKLIKKAQQEGKIDKNVNPALFAFFFDSLLMMIQFSYSCDYYRERLMLYCGEDIFNNNEKMAEELTKFLLNALLAK